MAKDRMLELNYVPDGGVIIPFNASESLYVERLDSTQMLDLTKWAQARYDHIVVRGDMDSGWYTIWCWDLPEVATQSITVGQIDHDHPFDNWEFTN